MKPTPKARRACIVALCIVILIAVTGFLVLPPIVKDQAEKRATAALGRRVSIGRVRMNPFMLSLTVEDLDIAEKGAPSSFAGWRRLYVRFDAIRSLAGDWVLGAVELDGFHASVVVNPDGTFNFSDLLALAKPPAKPAAPGRPVRVGRLQVVGASLSFADHSKKQPFTTAFGPVGFVLSDFRTVGSRGAPYHFEAVTDAGERLEWKGTLAADPVSSVGEFQVEGLVLKRYSPYLEGLLAADLTDGKLSLSGNYEVNLDPASRKLLLRDAGVHLRDLKIAERPTGSQVVALGALDMSVIQADAVAMKASLGSVSLSGGHVSVRRNADGSINLLALAPAGPPAPVGAPSVPLPDVTVADVAVKDFTVDVEDRMVPHAARLSLGGLQVSLRNFSLKGTGAIPLDASFSWAPKGTVHVGGTVVLNPAVAADLKADVTTLDLLPLSPYLEQFVNARLSKGSVTFSGKATASLASGAPQVALSGDLRVENLGLVDAAKDKELAGFALLSLGGVRVETGNPLALAVGQVDVEGPYARVRVNEDGSLNIASLVVARNGPSQAAAPTGPAPRITVGSVNIKGGDFSFSDHSIAPNVRVSLGDFSGTLKGLSSENMAKADVDLRGSVDGTGPVAISGTVDPLGEHPFVGIKVDVRNVDLVPLSAYSGRFAGYELARGQVVVDSKILVDGDRVDATNVVTLNQFTFGSATSSPVATALPVRLGIALLKDTEGKIVIDLPVKGSLSDPDFKVGKVVLRVVVNLLTKAAVSPFALVGSMFGGGGDELSFQEFAPGDWNLRDSEIPKLATLAKALANRPSLNLGMEGGYDAASDTYALRRRKLDETVRRRIWEERHAADPAVPPPEALVISREAYSAMVKTLFDAAFPPGTQFGTPLPPEPAAPPPPPRPAPGFLRRVVDLVTFQKERDERAAQKESKERAAAHEKEVSEVAAKGLPQDQMEGRLAEAIAISEGDLASLALSRAQSVRSYLVETSHIGADRLFLTGRREIRRGQGAAGAPDAGIAEGLAAVARGD